QCSAYSKRSINTIGAEKGVNSSAVTEFVLLGLPSSWAPRLLLSCLFSAALAAIVLGNLLIVVSVRAARRLLQAPMYFFLAHLAFLDLGLGCVTVPKVLEDLLRGRDTISFPACLAQVCALHLLGASEMLLLTAMAYDRYVAICRPLRYLAIMDRLLRRRLVAACWAGGFVHSATQAVLLLRLPFCGPNRLDNFYCDVPQVVKLACADTAVVEVLMVANSGLLSLACFVVLLASYAVILATLRSRLRHGRGLATCASHLTVVSLIFGPCVFIYLRPFRSFPADKVVSVFYTVVTPGLNPLVYTLRNAEVKAATQRLGRTLAVSCRRRPGE
ncbi:olfactory receptor 4Q3-like, partial [Tachyglossus aculeatus]|uniref:olfactory receptor 4Q3-like n=1 Tax=Tachyglossus aculeatus TaxID=9261 RepID=UPI0018F66BE3